MLRRLATYLSANEPLSAAAQMIIRAVVVALAVFALITNANAALYAGSAVSVALHSAAVSAAVAIGFLFIFWPARDPPQSARSGDAHERR
jgi:predicted Co/Zn/Cd cation transporter (cation efflux family)